MTKVNPTMDISELSRYNPWWIIEATGLFEAKQPRLGIYNEIWRLVTTNELITSIVGLRRVGKTTILKQLASDLISKSVIDKFKVLYFSFDESPFRQNPQYLETLIEYQLGRFPDQKIIFLFDEIQYVDYWNAILKKYWDLFGKNIKFIISGSSSLFIRTHARESLAGRILEIQVPPVGFADFLQIRYDQKPSDASFLQSNKFENEIDTQAKFADYLKFGEFPALYKLSSDIDWREYLGTWVVGKVLEHDLPKYRRIIRAHKLTMLSQVLAQRPGQLVELQNLAKDIEISRSSLSTYLYLLEQTYLYFQVYNCDAGFRTRKNRSRKIYPMTVNLYSSQLSVEDGFLIETYVANYLHRHGVEFYFWREKEGKEVDFIVRKDGGSLPIEVKYQNQIRESDLKNLLFYCRKNNINKACVISKYPIPSQIFSSVKIDFIPAYHLL